VNERPRIWLRLLHALIYAGAAFVGIYLLAPTVVAASVAASVAIGALLATAVACTAASEGGLALERSPEIDEVHLVNLRQLTFGGQNAEAYFSADGERLIFQRTGVDQGCYQQYVMNVDGSDMERVSNGLG